MLAVSVLALSDAAWALLQTAPVGLTKYESVVDPPPPVDSNGVVRSYAVFHPFGGNDEARNLGRKPDNVLWQFQVSCVGGNRQYVLGAVDVVRGLFSGTGLVVAGANVGVCQPPPGFQPPPPMPQPVDAGSQRLQVPLIYQVLAVPA